MGRYEEEEAAFRAPRKELGKGVLDDLRTLIPRMRDAGFVESEIEAALAVKPFTYRRFVHLPVYRKRLEGRGRLATAILFWLLQDYVPLEDLRLAIGDRALAALNVLGWLGVGARGVRSRVHLYPCCGLYFFTDLSANLDPWADQVYWLGEDSYTLAYCTPRSKRGRALDLCTGSGVHAILARRHSGSSLGIDINPRALEFSSLNASFNELETDFRASNCFSALDGQSFDLITLNPPFAPAPPDTQELYRAGGATGETVTEAVVRGLPTFLDVGGLFSMATEAPRMGLESPVARLRTWLGPEWGIAALYKHEFALEDYILTHVMASLNHSPATQEAEMERWQETYTASGITSMEAAQFYAVRLPAGRAGWTRERRWRTPTRDVSAVLGDWLTAVQAWHGPLAGELSPRLHPLVQEVYFSEEENALVEFSGDWREQPLRLEGSQAALLRAVQRGEAIEDLAGLRELGCELVLGVPGRDF